MMRKFRGWIPTVGGQMSYQDIGNVRHSSRPVVANVTDQRCRRIVGYQKRWLLDNPLINLLFSSRPLPLFVKEFVARLFLRVTGTFWLLCIAEHQRTIPPRRGPGDPSQAHPLCGKLFLFDRDGWKGEVEAKVRETQRLLDDNGDQNWRTTMDLRDLCQEKADFHAAFTLTRNGIVTLALPEDGLRVKTKVPDQVASQLFFFLKDISHEHVHHPPTTDTLTALYPITEGGRGEEDDIMWRYLTLSRLYRNVLRYSREAYPSSYDNAVGILAYAETFRHISMEALKDCSSGKEPWDFFPRLQQNELERSICANKEARVSRLQHDSESRSRAGTFLFSVLGAVIGYAGLIQLTKESIDKVKVDEGLVTIATYLLKYPLHIAACLFLVYYTYAYLTERHSIGDRYYVKNLSRLLTPLNYRWQATIAFGLVGLIQCFMYLFVFGK